MYLFRLTWLEVCFFCCQSAMSTKNEEDEIFCRVDKVTDRSKCELMGSRLLVIGHMSRENSD